MGNIGYVESGVLLVQTPVESFDVEHRPEVISSADRILSSVDDLLQARNPEDGSFSPEALADNLQNIATEIQERGMSYAVTKTTHEVAHLEEMGERTRTFMWLGKTALEVAMDGMLYHKHPAALERVAVEVDEARDNAETLRPGFAKLFISPRMSEVDATEEVAKQENLYEKDGIRVTYPVTNEAQNVVGREIQSLLVADVPHSAWLAMLNDPGNIFGKSLNIANNGSALPIMQAFTEMELPVENLPEGPVTLLAAVTPYISDVKIRAKVARHVQEFRNNDQEQLDGYAQNLALRQQAFDLEVVESIAFGQVTFKLERLIHGLQHEWSDDDVALIKSLTLPDGKITMSRELAARLSDAQQTFFVADAQALTGNAELESQIGAKQLENLKANALAMQSAQNSGQNIAVLQAQEMASNRELARNNVRLGGGCAGKAGGGFRNQKIDNPTSLKKFNQSTDSGTEDDTEFSPDQQDDAEQPKSEWRWTWGVCRNDSCDSRYKEEKYGGQVYVGPCEACFSCQRWYDKGVDPAKFAKRFDMVAQPETQSEVPDLISEIGLYLLMASEESEVAKV